MKSSLAWTLLLSLFLAGGSSAWSEPSFWHKAGTPTPSAPAPPQVAPLPADESNPEVAPTAVEAPTLPEPAEAPTPFPGKSPKRPTTAGLMSAVIPGSGHVYTGEPLKGLFFAGAFGVVLWLSIENFQKLQGQYKAKDATAGQLYGLAAIVAYGFGVQDAYDSANRYNRRFHLKLSMGPSRGPGIMIVSSF